jgi:hypothetical protein
VRSKVAASSLALSVALLYTPLPEKASETWGPAGLNSVEKDWCLGGFPSRLPLCFEAYVVHGWSAEQWSREQFPNVVVGSRDPSDGRRNGLRHCVWASRLSDAFGEETARGFLERHEADEDRTASDTAADLRYNEAGIDLARRPRHGAAACVALIRDD